MTLLIHFGLMDFLVEIINELNCQPFLVSSNIHMFVIMK